MSYYPKNETRNVFNRVPQVTVGRAGLTIGGNKIRPDFSLRLETDASVPPIAVRPGEKLSGWLSVPELRAPGGQITDAGTNIPISVFHGSRPGPTLAVIAGQQSYDHTPVVALQKLVSQLDPKQMSGTVILVHVANLRGYFSRYVSANSLRYQNLNALYPGRADGHIAERTAYQITKEVIERPDYLLDLRAGGVNQAIQSHTVWDIKRGGAELIDKSKRLAIAFGVNHIVMVSDSPFDLANAPASCAATAITRGKPAIAVTAGGQGMLDSAAIAEFERGVLSVLRDLQMLHGVAHPTGAPIFIDRTVALRSERAGMFYPAVAQGQVVERGALLGYVTDFHAQRDSEIRAPLAGIVLSINITPPAQKDEMVVLLGHLAGSDK